MREILSKNILLSAVLVLIIIAIATISLIIMYDQYKRNTLMDDYFSLQQKIVLDDLYSDYAEITPNSNGCEVLSKQISNTSEYSQDLFSRLRKINAGGIVESDNKIKYTYVLTNIKLWLYFQKLEQTCNIDSKVVLYFYPEIKGDFSIDKAKKDAETRVFERQVELLKEKCNFNVIALPFQKDISILDQMISDYNIVNSPAIVIKGKTHYAIPTNDSNSSFWKEINCN
ncbi:MAG: hypothetical protein WCX82_03285 [archaeon]